MTTWIEKPRFSCALGGALSTISALPDVVPIVHAASGCAGNLSGAAAFGGGYFGSGYCSGQSIPTSGVTETEIVFGGFERLTEQITATLEIIDAKLFIITTGCMTEMIGDDIEGVARQFHDADTPVIAVNTPSFKGNSYHGYELVLEGIFLEYLNTPKNKRKGLINLFGVIPSHDPFFRGDLEEVKRLLEQLGLEVNTFFTPGQTFENILSAPSAELNIVLSHTYGVRFAQKFEELHSVPFITADLPVGPAATDDFLRRISDILGLNSAWTEKVIKQENKFYYGYFERTADMFSDGFFKNYLVVVANSNTAIPYTRFAYEELGWLPRYVFVTDTVEPEAQELLKERFGQFGFEGGPELVFETSTSRIGETILKSHNFYSGDFYVDNLSPLFIFGSTLEKDFASKTGARYLPVSFPTYNRIILDRGYAGYRGGLHFFEDIVDVFVAPK